MDEWHGGGVDSIPTSQLDPELAFLSGLDLPETSQWVPLGVKEGVEGFW